MAKMIVNSPGGEQQMIEVGVGGEYFDPSLVEWDERRDGAMQLDKIELGSMVREGNNLIKLPDPLPEHKKWLDGKPKPDPEPDYAKMTLRQLIDLLKVKGLI